MGEHGFFEILDRLQFDGDSDGGRATGTIDPSWAQGRATFGGLVTAIGIRGMRCVGTGERKLRSVLTSFIGPVEPGEFELRIQRLRQGRSASYTEARLYQNDEVRCITLGNFGAPRQSTVTLEGRPRPAMPEVEALRELPFVPGISPNFTRYIDFRWALGGMPYSGTASSEIGGWCRHRGGADSSEEAIAGLVDAWPAPVIPMLRSPSPASSATWCLDFIDCDAAEHDGWWAFHGVAEAAAHGYAQARSRLWSPSGRLAAIGQQTFAVFG